MRKLEHIVGQVSDPEIADRLHKLQHPGQVEYLALQPEDMQRHRLRVTGDQGTEYAIAIPRRQMLKDGAVLMLGEEKAVVVRSREQNWLRLKAKDPSTALELGYFAGNMHWKVRFEGPVLAIALQGPEADYLTRLADFLAARRIERAP